MMAPAMTTLTEERLAYANLARQGARVQRRLPAAMLPRLAEIAPGVGEVEVDLAFRMDGSGRPWVNGWAAQVVDVACQRCLERAEVRLAVQFELCIVQGDEATRELPEGVDLLVADGETVSIVDIVEDELLLGLPERLCREEPCAHAPALSYPPAMEDVAEAVAPADGPFSVLAKLKGADS